MLVTNVATADYWTRMVSEETPPVSSAPGHLMSAFFCIGAYCDNIRIKNKRNGSTHGTSNWTSWFSEEGRSQRKCTGKHRYVTGVACRGKFCDNLALKCTNVPNKRKTNCYWTPWFSEERGQMALRKGYFAAGMSCKGSYCDSKRIYACNAK
jgi:hypothetical protein